jgi:hypothetical protein
MCAILELMAVKKAKPLIGHKEMTTIAVVVVGAIILIGFVKMLGGGIRHGFVRVRDVR